MQYELVRSNRRTLAITIDGSGRCVVRAPMRMPMAEIKKFIEEKRSWIENKLCEIELKTELAPREPEFKEGAEWVIAGNSVRIKFIAGSAKGYAQLAPDEFICSKKLGRPGLIKFLRGFARDLFYWRVDKYAQTIGVEPGIGSTGKMGLVQCAERAEFFVAAYFCAARADRLCGGT